MREHALPQDVTSYRFHIIGNMTLKQFAEVAIGVALGFVIYLTNLPIIIKWPMIALVAGVGALAAFVPFEERPLDQWLLALVRALYRPTQFYWKRTTKIPEPFLFETKSSTHTLVKEVDLTPARRQRVSEYLNSIDLTETRDALDDFTDQRVSEVLGAFENPASATAVSNLQSVVGDMKVSTSPPKRETEVIPTLQIDTGALPTINVQRPSLVPTQVSEEVAARVALPNEQLPSIQVKNAQPVQAVTQKYFSVDNVQGKDVSLTPATPQTDGPLPTSNSTQYTSVNVPTIQTIEVQQTTLTTPDEPLFNNPNLADENHVYVDQVQTPNQFTAATQATTHNANLPFPETPKEPNKIVGMVLDPQNTPLANTIVEIITQEGIPARAVKTNMLGQFFVTTPLNNGTYTLLAEKDGFQFTPQQLVLNGKIVEPIEVRSA